jgi:hypothetical protein
MTVVIIVVGIDDDLHDAMIVFMGIMMMTMTIATLRSREAHLRGFFGLLHGRLHAVADERSKGSDVCGNARTLQRFHISVAVLEADRGDQPAFDDFTDKSLGQQSLAIDA